MKRKLKYSEYILKEFNIPYTIALIKNNISFKRKNIKEFLKKTDILIKKDNYYLIIFNFNQSREKIMKALTRIEYKLGKDLKIGIAEITEPETVENKLFFLKQEINLNDSNQFSFI